MKNLLSILEEADEVQETLTIDDISKKIGRAHV